MPPNHMGAIGYGQFHPLVPNDSDEHRAKNRRVVFFVKNVPDKFDGNKKKPEKKDDETAASPPASDGSGSAVQAAATEGAGTAPVEPAVSEPIAETAIQPPRQRAG